MLNRIVIINSELYAKAAIYLGEYNEKYFIQKTETGFTPKKWDKILTDITTTNSINSPEKLTKQ